MRFVVGFLIPLSHLLFKILEMERLTKQVVKYLHKKKTVPQKRILKGKDNSQTSADPRGRS